MGKEIARHKDYSEETARHIDQEVGVIMSSRLQAATDLLQGNDDQLQMLAKALLERETVEDAEIRILLGLPERGGFSGGGALAEGRPA